MRCKFSRGRIRVAPTRGEPIFQLAVFSPPGAYKFDDDDDDDVACRVPESPKLAPPPPPRLGLDLDDANKENLIFRANCSRAVRLAPGRPFAQQRAIAPCDFSRYVKVLEDFIFATEKQGIEGLAKQYRKLDAQIDPTLSCEAFKQNMNKNRYSDVLCRDSTRVKLKIDASRSGDYIHANYVRAPFLHNTFICTQGPLQSTIGDFWRMAFQERVSSILMLCRPNEDGRPKCVVYWPEIESTEVHGCIRVKAISESSDDNNCFERVELLVEFVEPTDVPEAEQPDDKRPLNVTLIKWANWPDRGVPDERCHTVPQKVLAMVRHGPCLVHCSAGIGRTGSMVALEFAHRRLSLGQHVDFEKITLELRKQRSQCVQTEIQYLYIHRVMVAFAAGESGISQKARDAANAFLTYYDDHMRR